MNFMSQVRRKLSDKRLFNSSVFMGALFAILIFTQNFVASLELSILVPAGTLNLRNGESIDKNGITLAMQGNGNLVLSYTGKLLWASNTACTSCRAIFQGDGNLVVTDDGGRVYYATGTNNRSGGSLKISAAGPYLEILDGNGSALWTSFAVPLHDTDHPFIGATDAWDLIVQMVCEVNGSATSDDPYRCPPGATLRKLKLGEFLPYHKTDRPMVGAPKGLQISDSYPIASYDGFPRAVHSMIYHVSVPADLNFEMVTNLQAAYDVMVHDPQFVSIAGTYDQSSGFLPWYSSGCILRGGWVEMPSDGSGYLSGATKTFIQGTPRCDLSTNYGSTYTSRERLNFIYSSDSNTGAPGRILDSVRVMHFSGDDPRTANAIEVAYFTKLYGWTRWESWQSLDHPVSKQDLLPEDDGSVCNGATSSDFGTGNNHFRRIMCHDWSFVTSANSGGWNPSRFYIDPVYTGAVNLLKNTHMMIPRGTMDPWQRMSEAALNWTFDDRFFPDNLVDRAVKFSPLGNPDGNQAIYQDVAVRADDTGAFDFGTLLWTTQGQSARPTIIVFQNGPDGAILDRATLNPNVSGARPFFRGTFTKVRGATNFRFQVYANNTNVELEMSDAWITPLTAPVLTSTGGGDLNPLASTNSGIAIHDLGWSDIQAIEPSCNHDLPSSEFCATAVKRYCMTTGAVSGFGPVENNDTGLSVTCLLSSIAITRQETFDHLKTLTPTCDRNNVGTDGCLSASDNSCRDAGFAGGFGPVEHYGNDATVTCTNASGGTRMEFKLAELTALTPTCTSLEQVNTGPCYSAVHRACLGAGYKSGYPAQHVGNTVEAICIH